MVVVGALVLSITFTGGSEMDRVERRYRSDRPVDLAERAFALACLSSGVFKRRVSTVQAAPPERRRFPIPKSVRAR